MMASTIITAKCYHWSPIELLRHGNNNPQFGTCLPLSSKRRNPNPSCSGRVYACSPPFPAHLTAMAAERSGKLIDGKAVARDIREEIAAEVSRMKEAVGVVPGLAVILVGDKEESVMYVGKKEKACRRVGFISKQVHLSENSSEEQVVELISKFNDDPCVHGILVQLPLPLHMKEERILNAIDRNKDVDGFHPENMGCLAMRKREALFVPCTPKGCLALLHRYGVKMEGKNAVVIGRSNISGMPAALLLQREDATVTIVHSKTKNMEDIVRQADIVVSAAGKAGLVRGSWIKPGAVVIDVGQNEVEQEDSSKRVMMVGDVCWEEVIKVASAVTPVPGGVGPMTIAMLLSNTLTAAKRALHFH